jgi:hypothetical protein
MRELSSPEARWSSSQNTSSDFITRLPIDMATFLQVLNAIEYCSSPDTVTDILYDIHPHAYIYHHQR